MKHRAARFAVGGGDLAAEHVHEVPDDREAEAGAAGPRARLVDAIEALEDARQILGRDARARCPDTVSR